MEHVAPSLKKQLATTLTIALALLTLAFNFGVFQIVKRVDLKEFDADLSKELRTVAAMTTVEELEPLEIELELHDFNPIEFQPNENAKYYQLWDHQKHTFLKSRSLEEFSLENLADDTDNIVIRDATLPDGRKGRMASMSVIVGPQDEEDPDEDEIAILKAYQPGPKYRMYFSIAVSREGLNHALKLELALALLTGLILILGAVTIVRWLTNRCFQKFEALVHQMEGINYSSLSTRLDETELPRELLPFATQFNSLLGRLQRGVDREQRFATNISHELRTPISELRLLTEVGKRECDRGQIEDVATYFDDATELTIKMDRLIETVSAFNRLASGREEPVIETFHLAPAMTKACDAHKAKAQRREITVTLAVPEDAVAQSDRSLVSAILGNLIGNAVSHSPIGSTVSVNARREDSRYIIDFENPNTELKSDDLSKLAEPFWQKDSARSDEEHFGMGVALVESYCRLLDITCEFSLPTANVFRVTVGIPLAP
jgi:signal transduction histidine kinase